MQVELEPPKKADTLYPFVLTEEQEHLRREIREFARAKLRPTRRHGMRRANFPWTQ